jgi:hypothetical protein
MSQEQCDEGQVDLFLPQLTALPLRDQRETMERPFFSLSKRKRSSPSIMSAPTARSLSMSRPTPNMVLQRSTISTFSSTVHRC